MADDRDKRPPYVMGDDERATHRRPRRAASQPFPDSEVDDTSCPVVVDELGITEDADQERTPVESPLGERRRRRRKLPSQQAWNATAWKRITQVNTKLLAAMLTVGAAVGSTIFAVGFRSGELNNRLAGVELDVKAVRLELERDVTALQVQYLDLLTKYLTTSSGGTR